MNEVKMAQNSQQRFNQLIMNNPQLQTVVSLIQQGGGNSQQIFYALAKQMGIDPNTVLNALK
jgi:hypothetical protein